MAEDNYLKSDPSILLLNEIEILLAQTRLMELYLKQAQATAANEAARINQQHQAELAVLRAALVEKERSAVQQSGALGQQQNLADRLQQIEGELKEKQLLLESREREADASRTEIATLRGQIAHLEITSRQAQTATLELATERQTLEAETVALRQQLEKSQLEIAQRQSHERELEQGWHAQLAQLQTQLTEKPFWSQNSADELAQAKNDIESLQEAIAALQASRHETELKAAAELEQTRARFEAEVTRLQAAVDGSEQSRQESALALAQIEATLKSEIVSLRGELEQKHQQIELREGAWRAAEIEIGALKQRIAELEAAHQQGLENIANLTTGHDQARHSLENELAQLQHEIAVKERELTHRYEAVTAVELALHGKIHALQEELARSHNELAHRDGELQNARDEIAGLNTQVYQLESARAEAESLAQRGAEATRQQVENEINRLHAALAQKDYELKELDDASQARESRHSAELGTLREQLDRQQTELEFQIREVARGQAEIAALHERAHREEQARREAEENRQRSEVIQAELQARLQAQSDELSAAQNSVDELKNQLGAKINELELELSEKQLLIETRNVEIGDLKTNISQLSAQLTQLESAQRRCALLQEESEQIRLAQQHEMVVLRETFHSQCQALESQLAQEREQANSASNECQELARRAAQLETTLNERDQDLHTARSGAAVLQARLDDLTHQLEKQQAAGEELDRLHKTSQAEIAALQQTVQQKTWALAQQQAMLENLASAHKVQIQNLQAKLNERAHTPDGDLEKSQTQARSLQRRVEELESALRHAELTAITRAEQIKQEQMALIDELRATLSQKNAELQERSVARPSLDQSLREEADRLLREVQERNQILQDRNDELVRVKADLDATRDRFAQLESAASQAEAAASGEAESMRTEFQAQLALFQAELSQKEWALQEREATASGLEQQYRQEIESLRQQLAEKTQAASENAGALRADQAQWPADPRADLTQLEATMNGAESGAPHFQHASHSHRWGSGFAAKRRWKV